MQPFQPALVAAAIAFMAAGNAMAQSSPYYIGVSQSLRHESNLFRIPDSFGLDPAFSRSDTISGTALIAGVDQTIGRQRVYGGANLQANRYANNKTRDNDSYGLNLAVDWATLERLSGTLSVTADQQLVQINTGVVNNQLITKPNEARSHAIDARFRLGVVTRFTLEAALGHRQLSYSADDYKDNEYRQNSASLGVRYRPSSALSLGASLRLTDVAYPKFLLLQNGSYQADKLKRQDIDFTGNWQPSGASQFAARLSPTRTRYDRADADDFSGLTGSASWAWQATAKTRLVTTFSRDTGQSADALTVGTPVGAVNIGTRDESRITNALALRATHELTGKINLNAGLAYSRRALRTVDLLQGNANAAARNGRDNVTTLSLGARWLPTRNIQLSCDISAENQDSNGVSSVSYKNNVASCYGQFILQ